MSFDLGMQTPGLLRITGDFNQIDYLFKLFGTCPSSEDQPDLSGEDIHTLCGLLKQFLRALPDPLFHPILFDALMSSCVMTEDSSQSPSLLKPDDHLSDLQIRITVNLFKLLPSRSSSLLIYVISLLAQIPLFPENRIQLDSLATLFGPALLARRTLGLPGLGLSAGVGSRPGSIRPAVATPNAGHDQSSASRTATEALSWLLRHWTPILNGLLAEDDREAKDDVLSASQATSSTPPPTTLDESADQIPLPLPPSPPPTPQSAKTPSPPPLLMPSSEPRSHHSRSSSALVVTPDPWLSQAYTTDDADESSPPTSPITDRSSGRDSRQQVLTPISPSPLHSKEPFPVQVSVSPPQPLRNSRALLSPLPPLPPSSSSSPSRTSWNSTYQETLRHEHCTPPSLQKAHEELVVITQDLEKEALESPTSPPMTVASTLYEAYPNHANRSEKRNS